ncbi:MAG: hypothetical protein MJZ49_00555 [Bacteroidales bacterium]|nr:hypothetical protein [Bacteroidales bacterium]
MSEFDQLIREKINNKKYEYSAKSWQSFTKKAGWKSRLTALQTATIIIASVIVVSCGCLLGYKFLHSENSLPVQSETEQPCQNLVASDTVSATTVETDDKIADGQNSQEKKIEAATDKASKVAEDNENRNQVSVADTTSTKPAKERKIVTRERVRKIFVIDTDTIPSNDF